MDKLHRLDQENLSIEDVGKKMELYMIKASIREEEHVTIAKFMSGLSLEIQEKIELLPCDFHDVVKICVKV